MSPLAPGTPESMARALDARARYRAAGLPAALQTSARVAMWPSVPVTLRRTMTLAWSGELSHRRAIIAKCLECVGYQRAEAQACTATGCPLWAYRPGMAATEDFERETPQEGDISTDPLPQVGVGPDRALAEPAPRPTAVEEGRP